MGIVSIKNLKKIIKNPKRGLDYVLGRYYSHKAAKALFKPGEFAKYRSEVIKSGIFRHLARERGVFEEKVSGKTYRGQKYGFGAVSDKESIFLYALIRKFKPSVLVETGVCNGYSTTFILLALKQNKNGKLYSIDYPEIEGMKYEKGTFWNGKGGAAIPKDKQPGWIIPDDLRNRWELILGKSQDKLPLLLKKLGTIDFFIHDSEHSYECMSFEFKHAYDALRKGGTLASDDIWWNNSFFEICSKFSKKPIRITENIALFFK